MAVDRSRIEEVLPRIANTRQGACPLADVLRSSGLDQAERNELIRTLAADPHTRHVFLASEAVRTGNGDPSVVAGLRDDQKLIGQALQQALRDGAIKPQQLADIAESRPELNSAQTIMSTLRLANDGAPNSAVGGLSDALWDKSQQAGVKPEDAQRYQAVAATGYLSDPNLQAAKFGPPEPATGRTPEQAANAQVAFDALVARNEVLANTKAQHFLNDHQLGDMRRDGTVAAAQLFVSNGKQLTDHYTGVERDTSTLATFFKQDMFNPGSRDATLRDGRPVAEAVAGKVNDVSTAYLDKAQAAAPGGSAPDPDTMKREMGKLGHLAAGLQGGISQAITEYSDRITEHRQDRDAFAKSVGMAVGVIPVPGGKAVGAGVKAGTDPMLKALYDFAVDPPPRPDISLGVKLKDNYEGRAEAISPDAGIAFRSAHGSEADDLQLGKELKGFEKRADAMHSGQPSTAVASLSPDQLFDRLAAARQSGDPAAMDRALSQTANAEVNRDVREQAVASVDAKQQAALEAQQRNEPAQVEERSRGARSIG